MNPTRFPSPEAVMRRALELAERGLGRVEPNPPVGAVLVDENLNFIAEGWHEVYGGPHAEVLALRQAGQRAAGSVLFVTLEPCCHHGKTPPCAEAVIQAGVSKVVAGMSDPAPHVAGGGLARLKQAGIAVEVGLLEREARRLTAPFVKLITTGRPYLHAKWAMSLDGKIASRSGHSQWISGAEARRIVHRLRGRMDAVAVGLGTALADDPLLTARPPGPRTAVRIVVDTQARLPLDSQLVRTVSEAPVFLAAAESAPSENVNRLRDAGVEVLALPLAEAVNADARNDVQHPDWPRVDPAALLDELGRRRMTNILVEGGGQLLGDLFDRRLIDAVHVFVAPKLIGGRHAATPLAGLGLLEVPQSPHLQQPVVETVGEDVYVHGPLNYE